MTLRLSYGVYSSALIFCIGVALMIPLMRARGASDNTTIAKTYNISGDNPESGDVIAFDPFAQLFHLANKTGDPDLFGVVVTNPVIVLETVTGGIPIVNSGEVSLNVTTLNGAIKAGDYLTSSPIPGKAQRAPLSAEFIIGTALESFPSTTTPERSNATTTDVYSGSIKVLVSIRNKAKLGFGSSTAGSLMEGVGTGSEVTVAGVSTPIATLIKYLLATIVLVGTVFVAFRNFGSSLKNSIVSVGRNPLAKTSIQSMVVLNTVLIFFISMAGLFLGLLILFFPI